MNRYYRKINSLYFLRLAFGAVTLAAIFCFHNYLSEQHKVVLDQSRKAEEKLVPDNLSEKLKIKEKYSDKKEAYDDELYYFVFVIVGCVYVNSLLSDRVASENKKLDEFEDEKTT